jgi:hypothetical protein
MKIGLDPDPVQVQCIWICNAGITIANTSFLINRYGNDKSRKGLYTYARIRLSINFMICNVADPAYGTHCFFDLRIWDTE